MHYREWLCNRPFRCVFFFFYYNGPFGNILRSLRFRDSFPFFFFLPVCESSYFEARLGSCFLMPLVLVDWWFLVFLCVSLWPTRLFWVFSILTEQRTHSSCHALTNYHYLSEFPEYLIVHFSSILRIAIFVWDENVSSSFFNSYNIIYVRSQLRSSEIF